MFKKIVIFLCQKQNRPALFFFPLLFAGILSVLWYPFDDGDVWWHIAVGNEILRTGSIPAVDEWTYTAYGQPYIYHSWLSEAILSAVWNTLGKAGLESLKYAIHLVTCFYLFFLCRSFAKTPYAAALALLMAFWLSFRPIRPYIISPLFCIILMDWIYFRSRETGNRFAAILLLILLWANLHGGFPVGLLLLGVDAFAIVIGYFWGSVSWERLRWRLWLFPCALAITLVNPYGIRLYSSILAGVHNQSFDWLNMYLYPVRTVNKITMLALIATLLYAAWLIVRLVKVRQFADLHRLLITLACYYMALSARRLEWLLAFPLCLAIVHLSSRPAPPAERGDYSFRQITVSVALIAILCSVFMTQKISFTVSAKEFFPEPFEQYIVENNLEGNVFCPLYWSGRVTLASGGKLKTYIDGRLQLHPPNFFSEYLSYATEKGLTAEQIDYYGIDYLLIPNDSFDHFARASAPIRWRPVTVLGHGMLLKRL